MAVITELHVVGGAGGNFLHQAVDVVVPFPGVSSKSVGIKFFKIKVYCEL